MAGVGGRICAAHRLPKAREQEPSSSGCSDAMYLMPRDDLQQLSQHIDDIVPQPEHTNQTGAQSVEQAMRASHGTAGWACKAAGRAADLPRRWSARRSIHRDLVGAVQVGCGPICKKGLTYARYDTVIVCWYVRVSLGSITLHFTSCQSEPART